MTTSIPLHVSLMLIEHLEKCKKNTQERYLIVKFELPKSLILQAFPADESTKAVFHFECRTFDLSDNSPYTSSVILAPEECKKNTQERYEIVKSEPAQSPVRRTFSADETAGASKNFESAPLWPFRYRSAFHSLCGGFGRKAYLL